MQKDNYNGLAFIDLFAGCGGLSLGLSMAGYQGIFAIEKSDDAFRTLKRNFLDGPDGYRFSWPDWLEKKAHSIDQVLDEHESALRKLRGKIDLLAGGPPCQGFSFAGRRNKLDPRNMLVEKYVHFVHAVQPKVLVLENVPGMSVAHGSAARAKRSTPGPVPKSFYEKLVLALDKIGYVAEGQILGASTFGVPQRRPRLIVIGVKRELAKKIDGGIKGVFKQIELCRIAQLKRFGLTECVAASEAISDLATTSNALVPCTDPESRSGFSMPAYRGPKTAYQRLMHAGFPGGDMDSIRLANHRAEVVRRFEYILKNCRKGVNLSNKDRQALGMLKHRTCPIAHDQPAPTVTTLPDDLLHYSEPRILSVRESARLQSFPDWFQFVGKYTTGGHRRKIDCPRYTQVGNAVPPLLARAIGAGIKRVLNGLNSNVG